MIFDNLTSAAVAAASATAFLVALVVCAFLLLLSVGLVRKCYRQAIEVASLKRQNAELGRTFERTAQHLAAAREHITIINDARSKDIEARLIAESDARSAERRRFAAETRAGRLSRELSHLAECLDMSESMFLAAQAEKRRLRRLVDALEVELWGRDVQQWLDDLCPVEALADYLLPDEMLVIEEITLDINTTGIVVAGFGGRQGFAVVENNGGQSIRLL